MSTNSRLFDKKKVRRWRKTVFRELTRLGFGPANIEFAPGMILAGIQGFGTDVSVLRELTGYPDALIVRTLKRLRKMRILVGQTLRADWSGDGLAGEVAFVADVLVALGEFKRTPDAKRSAAQLARPRSHVSATRANRVKIQAGAVFTPKTVKSNPWYQIEQAGLDAAKLNPPRSSQP